MKDLISAFFREYWQAFAAFGVILFFAVAIIGAILNNQKPTQRNWDRCMMREMYRMPDNMYPIAVRRCKRLEGDHE